MSTWQNITGVVEVQPIGDTQHMKRYVLESVLGHLPKVTGSEGNMKVHIVRKSGHSSSASYNEFMEDLYFRQDADCDGWMRTQDSYLLVLEAALCDRYFGQTLHELTRWLNRLAKRVRVTDILVRLSGVDEGFSKKEAVFANAEPFCQMLEPFSWEEESGGVPAWTQYLLPQTIHGG